jgi:hypothetical protein
MAGGVGPTEVVAFTGQEVLVQDKSGNIVSGWPKSQSTFWQTTVGVNPSSDCGQSFAANDPDLVYDSIDGRWYAVHSAPCDYLAVSSGSTFATSTWKYITFGNANGDLIMKAGYDKNGVYITYTNAAGSSSFCIRIPKADVLWSGGGNIVTTHIAGKHDQRNRCVHATDDRHQCEQGRRRSGLLRGSRSRAKCDARLQ